MAYTKTLIGKLTMGHLGDRDITSIDDQYDQDAVTMKTRYEHARDAIYVSHDWKWAKRTVQLARLSVTPITRFTYAYALPSNYARLSNVSQYTTMEPPLDDTDYDITDGQFHTDAEQVYMDFVANDWSEAVWPAYFADCVSVKLAEVSCLKITHSAELKSALSRMLQNTTLPLARSTDSTAQPFKRKLVRSPWQQSRLGRNTRPNLVR